MPWAKSDILEQAIDARWPLTVTSTGMEAPRRQGAKFLSLDDNQAGIWVQPAVGAERVARRWQEVQTPLQGKFFDRNGRYTFATHLRRSRRDYWLTDRVAIEAWLLERPAEVVTIQERRLPRFRVSESKLGVQGNVVIGGRKGGARTGEVVVSMADLSLGGVSFVCPLMTSVLQAAPRSLSLEPEVHFGMRKVSVNGLLVYANAVAAQSMRIGIEFLAAKDLRQTENLEHLKELLSQLDGRTNWSASNDISIQTDAIQMPIPA